MVCILFDYVVSGYGDHDLILRLLATLLFVVSIANIGWGFVIRAKKERREARTTSETAS